MRVLEGDSAYGLHSSGVQVRDAGWVREKEESMVQARTPRSFSSTGAIIDTFPLAVVVGRACPVRKHA